MGVFHDILHPPSEEEMARRAFFDRFSKDAMDKTTLSQLDANRTQLYDMFAHDTWTDLDRDTKRRAIQALENDFAYQEGRPAKEVKITSLRDGLFGRWSPDADKIFLNENLVYNGKLYSDAYAREMPDANMQIFDTVAHEGYHAYQSYALEHPEVHADKEQLRSWALNSGLYYENGNEYLLQPEERDAWRFGRERTVDAFRGIEARNGPEPGWEDYEYTAQQNSFDLALERGEYREANILGHMEEEMQAECDAKGIRYDYAPESDIQKVRSTAPEEVQETTSESLDEGWNTLSQEAQAQGEEELEYLDLEPDAPAEGQERSPEEEDLEYLDLEEDRQSEEDQRLGGPWTGDVPEEDVTVDEGEDEGEETGQSAGPSMGHPGGEASEEAESEQEDYSMDQLGGSASEESQAEQEDYSMDQLADPASEESESEQEDYSMDQLSEPASEESESEQEDYSMDQLSEPAPEESESEQEDYSMDQLADGEDYSSGEDYSGGGDSGEAEETEHSYGHSM